METKNIETVAAQYFESLKDRRKQHIPSDRYVNNLSEASSKDVEADFRGWFAGFTSAIRLLDSKAVLPPLDSVLEVITKSFETEIKLKDHAGSQASAATKSQIDNLNAAA